MPDDVRTREASLESSLSGPSSVDHEPLDAETPNTHNYPLHILLFLATLLTTTVAGTEWVGKPISFEDWSNLKHGLAYSVPLLFFLTTHEFGHFFAAVYHRVKASLPFFIPMPPLPFLLSIGTFGAMIKIRERIQDSRSLFDVGVYGPLAGFVVALGVLITGFLTVPPIEYLYAIHPEYEAMGRVVIRPGTLTTGKNLLYYMLEKLVANPNLPPMSEMYHYPLLFAGWLGCFVTALNLLPVGQLDGGHVVYAMFGRRIQSMVARVFVITIVILGLPSFVEWLTYIGFTVAGSEFEGFPYPVWVRQYSWSGWIFWAFILMRFVRLDHPPVTHEVPLDKTRMVIGWLTILIFVLCFTPAPFGQVP
jgi:membrane-associated protease RseP (regulator of RpoE activity)